MLLGCFHFVNAQKPERIYSFAVVRMPLEWYKEQATVWKAQVDKNPTDGMAWYNYYYATRNALLTDYDDKRPRKVKEQALDELVKEMEKAIPESYEYNVCMWGSHWFDGTHKPYMDKVMAQAEGRTEHLDLVMNMGEISRNLKQRDEGAIKKWEAGLISPGMMYYNHNVLVGLEPNAILLTVGDNDTYPAWLLQARGFRRDVTVINLSLIMVDEYREKLFKELGLPKTNINWEATDPNDKESHTNFNKKLIELLAKNNKKAPVYLAMTGLGCTDVMEPVEDKLYLTGLAYLYSTEAVDEKALMKKNFEQYYTLDYLEHPYFHDISETLVPVVSQNYIVPMLKLYDHYKMAGDMTRQNWIKNMVISVSKGTESEKDVLKHVN